MNRARKVQQKVDKRHAAIPSLEKRRTVKTRSISFLIHSCGTNYVALSMMIVTSHIHPHAEVTVVIASLGEQIFAILVLMMDPGFGHRFNLE